MDDVQDAALRIASALAPTKSAPAARWRWGTVDAVNSDGTADVIIAGATVEGVSVAANVHVATGSRVRVSFLGTDAVVDASLTADEYPFANISSQGGDKQAQFYAHNGTATLMCGNDTTPSGQWGSKVLCTIPAGYRPKIGLYFPVVKTGSPQSDSYVIVSSADGVVTLQNWGGTQSSVSYFCTATWAY